MKIFPVVQVASIDRYTIQNEPIASIDLMERAATTFYRRFTALYPHGDVSVLAGPGNNGGDALAVARMLLLDGRSVEVFMLTSEDKLSTDALLNYQRLQRIKNCTVTLQSEEQLTAINTEDTVIDGLFGSGLNRPLEGLAQKLVAYINNSNVQVVSIDIPSGLFGEDNAGNNPESIVMADHTISFQFPKLAFLLAENEAFVGDWIVEDIGLHPQIIKETSSGYCYSDRLLISQLLRQPGRFTHKGDMGHALLLAGSYGKMGAAVLASKACLKAGAGLLTTHVPRLGYNIIQTAVPEAMACIDRSDILLSEFPDLDVFDAVGVGPGIGAKPNTMTAMKELLLALNGKPAVMDADALNILSLDEALWDLMPGNVIITPHPGEFDRLAGTSNSAFERLQKAKQFAKDMQVVIVLKGAYTAVINTDGHCYFNSSGNYGMATAGSGDALTGILLALLAQGYSVLEAARLGVYLHGLAADLLLTHMAEEAIVASDIISKIGAAFQSLRR
ncbi:NAD(P)H-hydrate dehydratase [Carboxylicivirga mesophila]|uniref:Bifunctional NAD(P)H-hydrate repair enzyme n=1 Tax=Carboxylicivirga mesophila TaxID=1166478 RepID=A0ABS5K5D7_9BACT|nr:NAD(P)H-hydrate dehydratase [Carboxylicivirga mesophila]MBS2210190.1 NAD(P)H-hydrate dehydratase [Carboxylicivirga mesophila]